MSKNSNDNNINEDNDNNEDANQLAKMIVYLIIIVLIVFIIGFMYNLIKCYLPKWKKQAIEKEEKDKNHIQMNNVAYDLQHNDESIV